MFERELERTFNRDREGTPEGLSKSRTGGAMPCRGLFVNLFYLLNLKHGQQYHPGQRDTERDLMWLLLNPLSALS